MAAHHALALAEDIVAQGFASFDDELEALLDDARESDVNMILVDVAADADAPVVVRERALGRVVTQLSRGTVMAPLPTWVTSRIRRQITV